ncbi:probable arginine--tRNA ligase, mitochondrial [Monomorium pharaonis]|uniref:probable arginine--tRNA ligase, mitochondrial n=1 Tax=Monomorium pharaonis TaxID=307658 RepID=UPI00063F7D28|nr:probable arginine--tRNA ligase, mitochondrial [Monomorium pharaonis]
MSNNIKMGNDIKTAIFKKITESLQNIDVNISSVVSHLDLKTHKTEGIYSFLFPLKTKQYNIQNGVQNIINNDLNSVFDDISVENNVISFNVSRDRCIKDILEHNCTTLAPTFMGNKKNVIVEFSSPNIAKPFHVGHLRSTIIGNYVANINSFVKNKVKKINYLGDWGTQYGLVQLGIDMANIGEAEMKKSPIKALYTAYVTANKLAETDSSILDRARKIFNDLENGTEVTHEQWKIFKQYTVEEFQRVYSRIGITFDEYHWESMYRAKNVEEIVTLMEKMQLLLRDEQNRKVVILGNKKSVPIIKSDGSTLYIARDIAAAIDRFEKNDFDRMYYVVDNTQTNHFSSLLEILKQMQMPWAERLKHVKFGRLQGMQTRRGNTVFLEDILDTARDIMKQKQIDSPTTKVRLDSNDKSSDILGISAMIVNDLKRKRQRDYTFDWNAAFDLKGDTGIKLQYTHCRLVSLERNSDAILTTECEPNLLQGEVVDDLVILIAKFEKAVLRSYDEIEPCILTTYLFSLSNAINKAFYLLKVKDELPDVASQRLLLFHVAKNVLAQGMKLLGLVPLEEM